LSLPRHRSDLHGPGPGNAQALPMRDGQTSGAQTNTALQIRAAPGSGRARTPSSRPSRSRAATRACSRASSPRTSASFSAACRPGAPSANSDWAASGGAAAPLAECASAAAALGAACAAGAGARITRRCSAGELLSAYFCAAARASHQAACLQSFVGARPHQSDRRSPEYK